MQTSGLLSPWLRGRPCQLVRSSASGLLSHVRHKSTTSSLPDPTRPISYQELVVGCPRESFSSSNASSQEKRVALTPSNANLLLKRGFKDVLVASEAGHLSGFSDEAYLQAGAKVISQDALYDQTDILLRIRRPDALSPEVHRLKEGSTLISMLYPQKEDPLLKELSKRSVNAFALELIPRISRAQSFDVLSSMANISGYKAVVEAANAFGRCEKLFLI